MIVLLCEITGVKPVGGYYIDATALCSTYPWWSDISQSRTIKSGVLFWEKWQRYCLVLNFKPHALTYQNDKLAHPFTDRLTDICLLTAFRPTTAKARHFRLIFPPLYKPAWPSA